MHSSVASSPHHLAHQSYDVAPIGSVFGSFARKFSSKKGHRGGTPRSSCSSTQSIWTDASSSGSSAAPLRDQPPTYLEAVSSTSPSQDGDDRWEFLRRFDTLIVVDDSTSMQGSNWVQTRDALAAITPICTKYDSDGIDVQFLNAPNNVWYENLRSPVTVAEIFSSIQPRGATPTGQKLHGILKQYLSAYGKQGERLKPLNIIVITDGEATDDVESTLVSAAKKLDRLDAPAWQVGVQFFQVGNSEAARQHLKYLDDHLCDRNGNEIRDIVDTVPWTGEDGGVLNAEGILKVVLGAVNRRLDRGGANLHSFYGRR